MLCGLSPTENGVARKVEKLKYSPTMESFVCGVVSQKTKIGMENPQVQVVT